MSDSEWPLTALTGPATLCLSSEALIWKATAELTWWRRIAIADDRIARLVGQMGPETTGTRACRHIAPPKASLPAFACPNPNRMFALLIRRGSANTRTEFLKSHFLWQEIGLGHTDLACPNWIYIKAAVICLTWRCKVNRPSTIKPDTVDSICVPRDIRYAAARSIWTASRLHIFFLARVSFWVSLFFH